MKKGVVALALAAVGMAGLPQSAGAVSAPGDEQAREIYDAGRCIVRSDRRAAVRLMSSLPLDGVADVNASQLGGAAGCVSPALGRSSSVLLRGAIAQELYLGDFGEFGVEPRNRRILVDLNLPVDGDLAGAPAGTGELYKWADCVVRNDTENTERLLRTRVGSRQEATVIETLRPYMSACIAAGTRLTVAPSELRSVFAQSAYNTLYRYWNRELRQADSRR
ncbi:MAG: hypothetical protein ACK4K7_11715 [Allosphingosinicella sp.]|uniref:hypothetical protein n=1 Tax=Allosphingosinicella sp. TaxID=2823234 RepID=UPI00392800D6